jgi:hypothetical protein
MRILELFSGSGSVGKVFAQRGWDVVSLDCDVKTGATIKTDILAWDHTVFQPGSFDVVWASPCCTQYSCARRGAKTPRNLDLADALVKRSLDLISYFEPRVWFIENPASGLLKDRPFMEGIPWTDADYCCYSDWGYRKRTRLWTNSGFKGKLCVGRGGCPNMEGNRHKSTAQQGRNRTSTGLHGHHHSTKNLYRIPEDLCSEIESLCETLVLSPSSESSPGIPSPHDANAHC